MSEISHTETKIPAVACKLRDGSTGMSCISMKHGKQAATAGAQMYRSVRSRLSALQMCTLAELLSLQGRLVTHATRRHFTGNTQHTVCNLQMF